MDYVFKGDDDILLVPENLYEHITRIGESQNSSELVGCMHKNEMVNRNINRSVIYHSSYRGGVYMHQYWRAYMLQ